MARIVVDLGCANQPCHPDPHESLAPLARWFHPDHLYGFDPWPTVPTDLRWLGDVPVTVQRKAAWTHDGQTLLGVGYGGLNATVHPDKNTRGEWSQNQPVDCFDFSRWITVNRCGTLIVKMDIEGSEIPVLERMVKDGTDRMVDLLLVEWHDHLMNDDQRERREHLERTLGCRTVQW